MNVLELVTLVQTKPDTTILYRLSAPGEGRSYYDHAACALEYLTKPTRGYINWDDVRTARFGEVDPKWNCSSCDRPLGEPCPTYFETLENENQTLPAPR